MMLHPSKEWTMTVAHILGFPRIGAKRELKTALESFWRAELPEAELLNVGRDLRAKHWQRQRDTGLDFVTVGDFAWYDPVLQTLAHLGYVPGRFGFDPRSLTLQQYFTLARGNAAQPAMEMTKWFDTNYHYLVPEWSAESRFEGGVKWLFEDVTQAAGLGHPVKVALLGPLTLLHLGKIKSGLSHKLDLLARLIPAYQRLLARLQVLGVSWVQIDEPILTLELDQRWLAAFRPTYEALASLSPRILLATYFESVAEHAPMLKSLQVSGIHLDLVRGPGQLAIFLDGYPESKVLSLGIVDGRNIWRTDLDAALAALKPAHDRLGERLWVSAGCSLQHVPVDLAHEKTLDAEVRNWLAFAVQKLDEIATLKRGLARGTDAIAPALEASRKAVTSRKTSKQVRSDAVKRRMDALSEGDTRRSSSFAARIQKQRARLKLPLLPTTTIGSFPQTPEIRKARAAFKKGQIGQPAYLEAMRTEIRDAVARQEALGLDVLVHGEAERNDMVEYFGELLQGFAFTENGWVQSYGSRCVKPPIIYGDVERPAPMTVEWSRYAQSLTNKPVKGMLTGPVTILQWSFVRDDQPRSRTAKQIALAIRDEVCDLEKAGIRIIQIDEPAIREGLPMRRADWGDYLQWAVEAFRLAACGVDDETQIHTHMCYSEFNDIIESVAGMDADVITIETSRSQMKLLDAFASFRYPNEIGPGVYDIHSPRVPTEQEITALMHKAQAVLPASNLWINPDCGLKTRKWPETRAALVNMVAAAKALRAQALREKWSQSDPVSY